ncbi:hypothetical protein K466DRAFT_277072 [Polyporus arcularius HHB13444]|uniref:Uncharacterized protein n=1 Tax=Polyporus arcularius HHB13444 TaxID=1314778 RepID=A0A5C3P1W5_9APHY|nr:hypothetical protein K466DRAFT_277072 [Polyporus arcularius HHB13444]
MTSSFPEFSSHPLPCKRPSRPPSPPPESDTRRPPPPSASMNPWISRGYLVLTESVGSPWCFVESMFPRRRTLHQP